MFDPPDILTSRPPDLEYFKFKTMRILTILAVVALLAAVAPSATAQGCSMCYASAAQQNPGAQQALNLGIIVLIIPPVLLFAGVLVTAFRRRDESDSEEPYAH